jgi:hypothetical protein
VLREIELRLGIARRLAACIPDPLFKLAMDRLIKLAASVEVLKRKARLHLPRSTPNQSIFDCALTRLPRMFN